MFVVLERTSVFRGGMLGLEKMKGKKTAEINEILAAKPRTRAQRESEKEIGALASGGRSEDCRVGGAQDPSVSPSVSAVPSAPLTPNPPFIISLCHDSVLFFLVPAWSCSLFCTVLIFSGSSDNAKSIASWSPLNPYIIQLSKSPPPP